MLCILVGQVGDDTPHGLIKKQSDTVHMNHTAHGEDHGCGRACGCCSAAVIAAFRCRDGYNPWQQH